MQHYDFRMATELDYSEAQQRAEERERRINRRNRKQADKLRRKIR